ncbi:siphovirus ReqiPepy6 Gp37-like family protein [Pseudobacillus sp. 179-B 2D1 NHS]|uniref:siphovirus ReqiPepy6 Gp37-like family protein n=1 Tax=Pseudobacillus sp. 179-B 2D1 NHS TaxID=3374292 RepID=UPI0038798A9F
MKALIPLRIIDLQFNLIDEITGYESLQITRSWSGIGSIELKINRHIRGANELLKDRIVFPHNQLHKAYVILHRDIDLDKEGKKSENWSIKALPLKAWLSRRITLPPSHTAYDNKQGDAETVMKHYVDRNAVNPDDPSRIIPNLVIAPSHHRGSTVSWSSRFKSLPEELEEISLLSGIGWNVFLDIQNKKFIFDVSEGLDLTAGQSVNPPVIFSPEFNSLKSMSYTESTLSYKNMAYVAGQGEGIDRRVVTIGTPVGLDRHELFVDARDVEETKDVEKTDAEGNPITEQVPRPEQDIINDLLNRGEQKLAEHADEVYLDGQILTKSPFVYEQDYDLGDIVTLQNREWGLTLNSRLTEIKEIYEPAGFQIEATFGNKKPTLIDKIKQGLARMNPELTK